ncbi:MAG: hypothetical protein OXI64_02355 [Defluviicoccus sp.]|nr:hypothetical protein [Defluviicoccus sp.]
MPAEFRQFVSHGGDPPSAPCRVFGTERRLDGHHQFLEYSRSFDAVTPRQPQSQLGIGRQRVVNVRRRILPLCASGYQQANFFQQFGAGPYKAHCLGLERDSDILQHAPLFVGELPSGIQRLAKIAVALVALHEALDFGQQTYFVRGQIRETIAIPDDRARTHFFPDRRCNRVGRVRFAAFLRADRFIDRAVGGHDGVSGFHGSRSRSTIHCPDLSPIPTCRQLLSR